MSTKEKAALLLLSAFLGISPAMPAEDLLDWIPEREALSLAKETGKPILYDFMADWCGPCKKMASEVFSDPKYADWIKQEFLTVRVKDEVREKSSNSYNVDYLQKKYRVRAFPTLVVDLPPKGLFSNSHPELSVGYRDPESTKRFLQTSLYRVKPAPMAAPGSKSEAGWILVRGWNQPPPGQGFNLYYSVTSGKGFKKANAEPISGTSFALNNLEAGVRYFFIVTMLKPEGEKLVESKPSQEFSNTAQPGSAPIPQINKVALYSKSMTANKDGITEGKTEAMVVMGDRYLAGNGVPKNLDYAKRWYKKAAGLGDMCAVARLEGAELLAKTWFNRRQGFPAMFGDFKRTDGSSNWRMPWMAYGDGGTCGTKISFPAAGKPPVEKVTIADGLPELAGHFSGHLGAEPKQCGPFPWATLLCDMLPGQMPLDFAAVGVPSKGFFCKMMLGPKHPSERQNYYVALHKFSITPDIFKNKGHDFAQEISGKDLSRSAWTEIRIDFPAKGARAVHPSKTFAQPDWTPNEAVTEWDASDIYRIGMGPLRLNQDFDFYVKDIGFY